MSQALQQLAERAGIEPSYENYWGMPTQVGDATLQALLAAMGYGIDERVSQTIPPVIVVREGTGPAYSAALTLAKGQDDEPSVVLESGERYAGDLASLPLGYHRITLRSGGTEANSTLIVVPARCFLPPDMEGRRWALSTQLYALRSKRNWGIGDFTDLSDFAATAHGSGAQLVAINPLHQLHSGNPEAASPYAPSSRLFLNPLYVDPTQVSELNESPEARDFVASPQFQQDLERVREREFVDYAGVAKIKRDVLELLFRAFRSNHLLRAGDQRALRFHSFVREGGIALERLARYEALSEFFCAGHPGRYGWLQWPAAYRDPESAQVHAFARERRERVEFYLYVQWLADEQLGAAAWRSQRQGTWFYRDLAVGVDLNGADAWADQQTIRAAISLGAPPDPLNVLGQNWGLPPLSPHALRERAYAPFAALLRANMRYAKVLRIDHVMSLRRAFWIPRGCRPVDGAYVRYPFEEMLGVLALESVRNRCAVVGEDLGTVPGGFRERMLEGGTLSSRVLYFERTLDDGTFLAPEHYPRLAAASAATHDLATLAGWWTGDDVALRRSIALYPDEETACLAEQERKDARFALVDALLRAGAIDAAAAARFREDAGCGGTAPVARELIAGVHRFLARTPSLLVVVAIEDVLGEIDAVNVPGTVDQYPNWRRKRSVLLEELQNDERLSGTAAIMRETNRVPMERLNT